MLVQGKKLLGTAYNGAPMGVADCSEDGCMIVEELEVKLHGGRGADGQEAAMHPDHSCGTESAAVHGPDRPRRVTVYVTDQPCWTCANMLANSGVKEIVYHRGYPKDSDKVNELMHQKGIVFRHLTAYEPPAQAGMNVIS